ncbi:uncharacterized protein WM277_024762 [Molossus nigricans]
MLSGLVSGCPPREPGVSSFLERGLGSPRGLALLCARFAAAPLSGPPPTRRPAGENCAAGRESAGEGHPWFVSRAVCTRRGFADRCHRFCQISQAEIKENITFSAACLLMCGVVCSSILCRCQNKCVPDCSWY